MFLEPPFNMNADSVRKFPPELTGNLLLKSMNVRLGWKDLSDKKLLDFGCGVRFAQTLVNLEIPIANYTGVDVNAAAIDWLRENISKDNFEFHALDMRNDMYRHGGKTGDNIIFPNLGCSGQFDAACMFSVITHQIPEDAKTILNFLRRSVAPHGKLYFTAFIDDSIPDYVEAIPEAPLVNSTYNPDFLRAICAACGWKVENIYDPSPFQMHAVVCSAS